MGLQAATPAQAAAAGAYAGPQPATGIAAPAPAAAAGVQERMFAVAVAAAIEIDTAAAAATAAAGGQALTLQEAYSTLWQQLPADVCALAKDMLDKLISVHSMILQTAGRLQDAQQVAGSIPISRILAPEVLRLCKNSLIYDIKAGRFSIYYVLQCWESLVPVLQLPLVAAALHPAYAAESTNIIVREMLAWRQSIEQVRPLTDLRAPDTVTDILLVWCPSEKMSLEGT